ncbi:MAG: ferrous iron transporter B [Bacteroidetes bacterium]|nr:ferrous iron transporter B [Bacteroidota bacterium]
MQLTEVHKKIKIALVGTPNSGKSTLFNQLTGLKQKTGNFAGVTVDKKSGIYKIIDTKNQLTEVSIIDLPGIYSFEANSIDEEIAVNVLSNKNNPDNPDAFVFVIDATNLRRNLYLLSKLIPLNKPMAIVVTMSDVLEKEKRSLNLEKLAELTGLSVFGVNARNGKNIMQLKQKLVSDFKIGNTNLFFHDDSDENWEQRELRLFKRVDELVDSVLEKRHLFSDSLSKKADKILTHKVGGYLIFVLILSFIFQAVFWVAAYPMEWIENFFSYASSFLTEKLPPTKLTSLLVDGVLAGLGGVIIFIPQIAFLFGALAILEDTGYMSRVSFIMDRLMKSIGLNGKSVIPLVSGVACAVPAIMSTRIIAGWKERLITILVIPLTSCSARLPVFTLLIGIFVPSVNYGIFNLQGLFLMGLYLLGFLSVIVVAIVLNVLIKNKEKSFFVLELPAYKSPHWKNVGITIVTKVKTFVGDAGGIIIAISIVLWFLASHAPNDRHKDITEKYDKLIMLNPEKKAELNAEMFAKKLEVSYAGIGGKFIEPLIKPLGFDWKIGIALITSFAAREVFVGTISTIYSVGNAENEGPIREVLKKEINPDTLKPQYSIAVCVSLLLFYVFALQCMSTLAVVYRETKSTKWTVIQFLYTGVLAYMSSYIAFSLLS